MKGVTAKSQKQDCQKDDGVDSMRLHGRLLSDFFDSKPVNIPGRRKKAAGVPEDTIADIQLSILPGVTHSPKGGLIRQKLLLTLLKPSRHKFLDQLWQKPLSVGVTEGTLKVALTSIRLRRKDP